ncbi:MAG: AMP-binding protein [Alphaproteobacteria bacterium]|nr:AMP-binding protein [Alphaproteobacteria bacterium]
MNLNNLLTRAARSFPDRVAVAHGTVPYCTYGELAHRAAGLAGSMQRLGLAIDDRVGLFMTNCPQYLEVFHGVLHAGMATLPINSKLHEKELAYILDDADAHAVFVTPDLAEKAAAAIDEVGSAVRMFVVGEGEYSDLLSGEPVPIVHRAPDDLAWLFYTSGTTGQPKGAMLSHRNLWDGTLNYFVDIDRVPANGSAIHAAPMSHGSGFYGLPHLPAGAKQVVPESGGFDPAEIYALIEAHSEVSMFAAPTMVKRLVEHDSCGDTSNLRTITYGGGPMYVADCKRALERLGPKLVQIYGQGESPMTITVLPREDHMATDHPRYEQRLASVGYAQSVVEVRVADADDNDVPAGEVGEILVRGDVVMKGYWDQPEVSAEALRGGWLHTGDMGAFDEDGYLTLKDRSKDMIISGGSNIYPREIEEVLLRHPAVSECAVVGRPHEEWGEEVIAFVAPVEGETIDTAELDKLCLDNIARFKRPKDYRITPALPKNNYGKIVKRELRIWLESEDHG